MTLKEFREKTKDMPENTVLTVGVTRWGDWDIFEMNAIIYNEKGAANFYYNPNNYPTLLLTDED